MQTESYPRNILASQINYSQSEKKIRNTAQYTQVREQLQETTSVNVWKDNYLEIEIISKCNKYAIRQIKEPICIEGCSHIIFDLYDLDFQKNQMKCNQCKKQPTKDNIKLEKFYKNLVANINEKAFLCSYYAGLVFHTYSKYHQPNAYKLLSIKNNEVYLEKIINQTNQKEIEKKLADLVQAKMRQSTMNLRQIIKMYLFCLLDAQKMTIPIMFRNCQHLECYEYTNILKLIEKNKSLPIGIRKTQIKCYHLECETIIKLDMEYLIQQNQILFPKKLAETISKEYSFVNNLSWNFQFNQFVYDKKSVQEQEWLRNMDQNEQELYHYNFFTILQKLVNKEISGDFENQLKFSTYTINLQNIKYPSRCMKCPLNMCFDLIEFVAKAQSNKQIKCFSCQSQIDTNEITNRIYFDKYLAKAMSDAQVNQHNFTYNYQQLLTFKLYMNQHQTLNTPQIAELYLSEKLNPYPSPQCFISKQRLISPIVLPQCKKKRAFELNQFFEYVQKKNFQLYSFNDDYKCDCQFCSKQKYFQLDQFFIDSLFINLLTWFDEEWDKNVNHILNQFSQGKKDIVKPKIIQKKLQKQEEPIPQFYFKDDQLIPVKLYQQLKKDKTL